MTRAEVLRQIAAAVLEPAELLAAYAGNRTPAADRCHHGVLATFHGSYRVNGDVVEIDGWKGITESVPLTTLLALAAEAGTQAAANRLADALAEQDGALRDMQRYIREHGIGGLVLSLEQQRAPEWQALVARSRGVSTAAAAWWSGEARPAVPGEQLDVFATLTADQQTR